MVLRYFGLSDTNKNMSKWEEMVNVFNNPMFTIKIGVVGKYVNFGDAYISLKEALNHGGMYHKVGVDIKMINSLDINDDNVGEALEGVDAVIVPGGFGSDGIDGKISAIKYSRENNIPFFGICLGMQLAVIEYARNILGFKNAISTEFEKSGDIFVGLMEEWVNKSNKVEKRKENGDMGGTMRLGLYECDLKKDSKISAIYGYKDKVWERHRHRFEINNKYFNEFHESGLDFSGTSSKGSVIETMELKLHRWFIGTQFHPELSSKIFSPHPLFISFIKAGMNFSADRKNNVLHDNAVASLSNIKFGK
uniref:CTP synthase (glutamine hydrolyzing) n=1 Tax=Biomphalaria glabrata TaxID=6526 RepID=A0A2C9LQX3_BIOGL